MDQNREWRNQRFHELDAELQSTAQPRRRAPEQPVARETAPVTITDVVSAVALHYRVPVRAIRSRKRYSSQARHVAMYLAHEVTGTSWSEIGRRLGCHHTTVLAAAEKIRELIGHDAGLVGSIEAIRARLESGTSRHDERAKVLQELRSQRDHAQRLVDQMASMVRRYEEMMQEFGTWGRQQWK
jgi:hypothetical protein